MKNMDQYKYFYLARVLTAKGKFVQNQVLFFANIPARKDIDEQTLGTIKDAPKDAEILVDGPYHINWPGTGAGHKFVIYAIGQDGPPMFWCRTKETEGLWVSEYDIEKLKMAAPIRFDTEAEANQFGVDNLLVQEPKLIISTGTDLGLPPDPFAEKEALISAPITEVGPAAVAVLVDMVSATGQLTAYELESMAASFIDTWRLNNDE